MIIRKMEEKDIESVVDIKIFGWLTAYKGIIADEDLEIVKNSRAERIEKRKKDFRESHFIVAEENGEVVGFSRYVDDGSHSSEVPDADCELIALYVKPEFKRRGIGSTLLNYVRDEFRQNGKTRMILWCLKENYPSRKFYETMGGHLVAEKEFELNGHKYTDVGFLFEL